MKKDNTDYLHHILDTIDLIEEYTNEMSKNEFLTNSMARDAAVRQIEIIGETARNLSDEYQELHPKVPWGEMIGIRNKIIHEYFNVNFAIVWDTVKTIYLSFEKSY